jgi:cell division protein FtsA
LDITLQPLAAGAFALSKDEKNLGVALIDIGGGSTTIALFEQGGLQAAIALPIGGDHITKDISIGMRTSSEDAEKVKTKYGHAFYDHASEDVVFNVPIIGSDQQQQFNQLELSDIIEARAEEIFELVQRELKSMGINDLPGGFVLTGGVANTPGILELAQSVFQNRVRIAIPDYIGVREPQYTTAVGLIKFAYKNAKIQGKQMGATTVSHEPKEKRPTKQTQAKSKPEKQQEEKVTSKVKKFFGLFFD